MLPPNSIVPLDDTHANIPTGWTRDTRFDSKFPRGYSSGVFGTTGGSTTHTHTSPSHTHTMVNHTHTYRTNEYDGGGTEDSGDGDAGNREADEAHYHDGTSGAVSGGSLTGSATIGSGSSLPPYYSVIYIKTGIYANLPINSLVFRNDTKEPTGFNFCDGTDGTPDLTDKYLMGAATDADAGSTGGSFTHTHTYNHTHTAPSHTHAWALSGDVDSGSKQGGATTQPGNAAHATHYHNVTLASKSTALNSVSASFTSATVEPAHVTLRINKNTSGAPRLESVGDIILYEGETAPVGWLNCDGTKGTPNLTDRYIKGSTTSGVSSGSNTHVHTSVASHTHSATGTHNHTLGGISGPTTNSVLSGAGGHSHARADHLHTLATVSSVTASWNSITISADSSNGEPPYITVKFIQATSGALALGGALLTLL